MRIVEQRNDIRAEHACPAEKLAAAMREARRLTHDLQSLVAERTGCRHHPRLDALRRMAQQRSILDPKFQAALRSVIDMLDRRLGGTAVANRDRQRPAPAAPSEGPDGDDDLSPLVALRTRSAALFETLEDVLDAVMAGAAIEELRFFPDFGWSGGAPAGGSAEPPKAGPTS